VCSLEVPLATARRALECARRHGALTILNPAPLPDRGLDFLDLADYVTPNEGEAARLTGLPLADFDSGATVAAAIRARGAAHAVVTLGAGGVLAEGRDERVHVPAFEVTAIDTTGAGDAFNGALAVALAERRPMAAALRFANAAAALACTVRGAQPSLPTRREVERFAGR